MIGLLGLVWLGTRGREEGADNFEGGTTNFVDTKGKVVEAQRLMGQVKEWDQAGGILTVEVDGSQRDFKLNPPETVIFVPVAQAKTKQVLMIKSKENIHWPTAFCSGDAVTIGVEGEKVVGVENGGSRMCGLKE